MISRIGALTLIAILLASFFVVWAVTNLTITNQATLKTTGVESDISSIDWGIIEPDFQYNQTINFRRTGNVDVTLAINIGNWIPMAASQYMNVTWDYAGQSIGASWVPVVFMLNVFPNASASDITSLAFDIDVAAT